MVAQTLRKERGYHGLGRKAASSRDTAGGPEPARGAPGRLLLSITSGGTLTDKFPTGRKAMCHIVERAFLFFLNW